MKYVKFFLLATAAQLVLLGIAMAYDWYVGLPNIGLSSPADLYWWPLSYGSWGHANLFIAFVGPLVLIGYSLLALAIYLLVNIVRNLITRNN